MAGQSLTLECDANGFPAPEITWLKDGRQVGVSRGWMGSGWDMDRVQAFWTGSCRLPDVAGRCGKVTGVFGDALGAQGHGGPFTVVPQGSLEGCMVERAQNHSGFQSPTNPLGLSFLTAVGS